MKNLVSSGVAAIAVSIIATVGSAQAQDNPALVWGAVGVGAAAPTTGGDGIANIAQLVIQKNPHYAALRTVAIHDIDRPTNEIGELSALYGRTRSVGNYPVVVATGLSAVGFFDCPDDDDSCFTFGVPLVAEVSRNSRFVGIGFQAFTNINTRALYAGGVLIIKLGKLR